MFILPPSVYLFSSCILLSTILALSSPNILFMWMMLEFNLMSFIPMMTSNNNKKETQSAIKYLLAQALGSSLFIISSLSYKLPENILTSLLPISLLLFLSLSTKLGAAPFHFWFPHVMQDSNWLNCIILSTWQKIIPLSFILLLMKPILYYSFVISSMSVLVGGLGGIMQTQLTTLMAYSSINHIGWMLSTSSMMLSNSLFYFFIYFILTLPIMLILWFKNVYNIKQATSNMSLSMKSMITLFLLSLGGLPPLLGFFPKLLILNSLYNSFIYFTPLILVLGSMMSLSFYINIILSMYFPLSSNILYIPKLNYTFPIMMFSITMMIFTPIIFYL